MINILLCCSGGFSSSLVVSKIKQAAKDKKMEVNVWAINQADINENIEQADIVMIAPQIQFMQKDFSEKCRERKIPLDVISQMDYGRCNGANILNRACELLGV